MMSSSPPNNNINFGVPTNTNTNTNNISINFDSSPLYETNLGLNNLSDINQPIEDYLPHENSNFITNVVNTDYIHTPSFELDNNDQFSSIMMNSVALNPNQTQHPPQLEQQQHQHAPQLEQQKHQQQHNHRQNQHHLGGISEIGDFVPLSKNQDPALQYPPNPTSISGSISLSSIASSQAFSSSQSLSGSSQNQYQQQQQQQHQKTPSQPHRKSTTLNTPSLQTPIRKSTFTTPRQIPTSGSFNSHRRTKSSKLLADKSPTTGNPFYVTPSFMSPKITKKTHKKNTSISNIVSFQHLDKDLALQRGMQMDAAMDQNNYQNSELRDSIDDEESNLTFNGVNEQTFITPYMLTTGYHASQQSPQREVYNSPSNSIGAATVSAGPTPNATNIYHINENGPLGSLVDDKVDISFMNIGYENNEFTDNDYNDIYDENLGLLLSSQGDRSFINNDEYPGRTVSLPHPKLNHLASSSASESATPLSASATSFPSSELKRIQRSKSSFNLNDIATSRSRGSSLSGSNINRKLVSQYSMESLNMMPMINESNSPSNSININEDYESPMKSASASTATSTSTPASASASVPASTPIPTSASASSPKRRLRKSSNIKLPERLDLPQQSARSKSRTKKSINDDKKIHECPLCKLKFQRPEHVKRHLLSHSSEKPFQCQEEGCGKRFNRNDNLKQHLRNIHKKKI